MGRDASGEFSHEFHELHGWGEFNAEARRRRECRDEPGDIAQMRRAQRCREGEGWVQPGSGRGVEVDGAPVEAARAAQPHLRRQRLRNQTLGVGVIVMAVDQPDPVPSFYYR